MAVARKNRKPKIYTRGSFDADIWDPDAIGDSMKTHYLSFNRTQFEADIWYVSIKNFAEDIPLIVDFDVTVPTSDEPICYNDCSGNGKCEKSLECQCDLDYLYKDCSVFSVRLQLDEKNYYTVSKDERKYFYFFAYQDSEDLVTYGETYNNRQYSQPLKKGLPVSSAYVEIEPIQGYGTVRATPDNKDGGSLPNSYTDVDWLYFWSTESKDYKFRLSPEYFKRSETTRVVLGVEADSSEIEFGITLKKESKGN